MTVATVESVLFGMICADESCLLDMIFTLGESDLFGMTVVADESALLDMICAFKSCLFDIIYAVESCLFDMIHALVDSVLFCVPCAFADSAIWGGSCFMSCTSSGFPAACEGRRFIS